MMDTDKSIDAAIAAVKTMKVLGYTFSGGELWKPPLLPLPKVMSTFAPKANTSEQHVVATYTRKRSGTFFNATAAGLALPPGKYQLCVAKDE